MRSLNLSLAFAALLSTTAFTVVPSASAQTPAIVRVSGGVIAGTILKKVNPSYPPITRAEHVSGAVVLHVILAVDGTVESVEVISGPDGLRAAAIDAVSQWLYKPYLLNGQPVRVDTTVTLNISFGADPAPESEAAPVPIPRATGPTRLSGGVIAGMILNKVAPTYPPIARAAHVSGAVVLHAIISKEGTVEKLAVISGPEMLRAAAVSAVSQWTYKPYLLNGDPCEVDTTITVNFYFDDPATPAPSSGEPPTAPSSSAPSGPSTRVGSGEMTGYLLQRVAPIYPPIARAAHVSGAVILHAIIAKDGTVQHLEVLSGPEMLRAAAMAAVSQWTYRPYLLNGEPTPVDTTITVNFNFGGG